MSYTDSWHIVCVKLKNMHMCDNLPNSHPEPANAHTRISNISDFINTFRSASHQNLNHRKDPRQLPQIIHICTTPTCNFRTHTNVERTAHPPFKIARALTVQLNTPLYYRNTPPVAETSPFKTTTFIIQTPHALIATHICTRIRSASESTHKLSRPATHCLPAFFSHYSMERVHIRFSQRQAQKCSNFTHARL